MNAVIDEDLPRSFGIVLSQLGFTVFNIRDRNLRGSTDDKIFLFAQKNKAVLFSADLGFSNILRFPLGTHHGICILRFPNEASVSLMNKTAKTFLGKLLPSDYHGNLIIISPGALRIRRFK